MSTQGLFKKYRLELISRHPELNSLSCYHDLNKDGNSEWIRFLSYENAQVLVYNINEKLEEAYNLPGKWTNNRRPLPTFFFGDANGDNNDEIFAFTVNSGDSLFISLIGHHPERKVKQHRFIHRLSPIGGNYDFLFSPVGLEDNNGDGYPEFLFVINAGFPLQPRAVFAWDLKNDSLYRSPLMGASIKILNETLFKEDINSDGIKELFLRIAATDNYTQAVPYPDNDSWLMVFTKNLKFLFEPVCIEGAQTEVIPFPLTLEDSLIIGAFIHSGRENKKHSTFQFYDCDGKKRHHLHFPPLNRARGNHFISADNNFYISSVKNTQLSFFHFIPEKEKIKKLWELEDNLESPLFFDCDNDGKKEAVHFSEMQEKFCIVQINGIIKSEVTIPKRMQSDIRHISLSKRNSKKDKLLLIWNGTANYLEYGRNSMYYFNFVFALFYYLLLVLALTFLKKIWLKNLERQQQTEKEMQQLQMQTIMNQLNPHFTYNAINTVGAAILQNDSRKAYDSLTRVSRLFRKSVDHAFIPYKTLGQEIDFVQDYLEVEKLRFGNKLHYRIHVDKSVDLSAKIPKMLIQIFVENAIKHGLFHKKEAGMLSIDVHDSAEGIEIIITDNGIGRQQAQLHNNGKKGKGIIILQNYLRLFKEQFNREIIFEITDNLQNNRPMGTRVFIQIKD